jgi:hypothetical protein
VSENFTAERVRELKECAYSPEMFGRFRRGDVPYGYGSDGFFLVARPVGHWPEEVRSLFPDTLGLETLPGLLFPADECDWAGRVDASVADQWCGEEGAPPTVEAVECEHCGGTGECTSCHCENDHECGYCDGTGEAQDEPPPLVTCMVGPRVVQRSLLGRAVRMMEADGVLALSWRGDILHLAFGDARAVVMRYNVDRADLALPVELQP